MADKDFKDLNQKAVEEPADSSRTVIEQDTPLAEKVFHNPGDVGPTEHGVGTDGPANYYSEEANKGGPAALANPDPEDGKKGETGEGETPAAEGTKFWQTEAWSLFGKPVVVLLAICLVVSFLLGLTNYVTAPIIEANVAAEAQNTRKALLPAADDFEDVTPAELPSGALSMFRATNGAGYVIEAQATGYGGKVPAMVAFDANGTVVGVEFLANSETPGLGQNIVGNESFQAQYTGRPAARIENSEVDKIASATISSNAATAAVNAAIELYNAEVLGDVQEELTPEEARAALLPEANEITEISVDAPNVVEAYAGDDGSFIIYAQAPGLYGDTMPVTAGVAMTADGVVLGVVLDTSNETEGYGRELESNSAFKESFVGVTSASGVDSVAGSTISSDAVKQAVDTALDALGAAKEAV